MAPTDSILSKGSQPDASRLDDAGLVLARDGVVLVRQALPEKAAAELRQQADACYERIEAVTSGGGSGRIDSVLGSRCRYLPASSSVSLEALGPDVVPDVVAKLTRSPLVAELVNVRLGGQMSCDLDQCWLRRQYAPSRRPAGHSAHSWHQDGALGFDFNATGSGDKGLTREALLQMLTVWVALTACGEDAPGLELTPVHPARLLKVKELQEFTLQRSSGQSDAWSPVMKPGDALVIESSTLHRTYVRSQMMKDRTSIEVRLFPARNTPPRLSWDRFIL